MKDKQKLTKEFDAALNKGIISGSLKFSNQYCSQIELYQTAKDWVAEDPSVIYASIRTDGEHFIALDFRLDENKIKDKSKLKSIIYDYFKPYFEKKLQGDFIQAWSVSRDSIVIK